ncbi:precorrin-6y C5,15-methyltransferase (decarboxylating) subunit CbiE [Bradyrhizobium sp. ISRA443]|uniref:precorrin-6y C5,15-methyltransferase (decarboxylating) subunit CbiE n=1 Tax=unclassified Bradyrhizobium TaxID=2631580 RepID=UPI0024797EC6|nr:MULTISPECIES: precorrin-6y C5,15-methyltransferase (decarboxylating) subunit CbiE [unclassified Bradyrhizobium]WGR95096.1 precorrin-6y C5,15-methyltransferase (decarboxylating) subunit CbiE [Bradyrhizobium sp. ISRA435]WGR99989.1 precorrin-6y C5,15-methyltransferase (decarboxylating) subunit CbiE [Bradyrhizobium sp. ISRA436]WGS06880.1 precorrin-6y C5,15-methyltransferase (decarboxylating) subunit CbiE [Bradyrhizobium sp. ISRA437]WGS13762.1 precorrin-6y C5,15-methyltransferase (decarboxylating
MGNPWLTIIGIGEDGLAGLSEASRKALRDAETVFGGERHLALAGITERGRVWPVPFDAKVVLSCRGRPTAVLASCDPFWHGVGGSLTEKLEAGEWIAYSAPSTFSLAAARLGWRLENVVCLGLHAAPFERLLPHLARGARIICLVRDGRAAGDLARWLSERAWGSSTMWALSALGGPRERITQHRADRYAADPDESLVAIALEAAGSQGIARSSGLPDTLFVHDGVHDGQLTKRPIRALALSALAPRSGERLWDIGAGSGSISIEWAFCGGTAIAIEARGDRAANIRSNAESFGLTHRITVIEGAAPEILPSLATPDAVFLGGGLDAAMFDAVWSRIAPGTRLVAHAVTLETQALLADLHQRHGGELMRVEIAHADPLGKYRSWKAARPIVQWSAVK